MSTSSLPDAGGHFGPYGGRYVPEVLMSPLEELESAYAAARIDPDIHTELSDLLHNYAGRPTPLYYAKRLSEALQRRANLVKARRPAAYRRAQDQQLPWPDSPGAPHGQAPHHCRNRRRPAWCRNCHRVRALRLGVRRLHGRRRHAAPAAQRVSHASARRSSRRRFEWQPHFKRCHQRSHARLGY